MRSKGTGCLLIALSGLIFVASRPSSRAAVEPLNAQMVADAVKWAAIGTPEPYLLRFGPSFVAGYVYTLFVRVAMAAYAAKARGSTFDVTQLPKAVTEPTVYFALRWYCAGDECRDPNFNPVSQPIPAVVIVPSGQLPPSKAGIKPLWVSADMAVLERFGGKRPAKDVAVVAAFPQEAVRTGFDVFAYREYGDSKDKAGGQHRGGRLWPDDVAKWR